jgi:hypothetical protein
MTVCVVYVGDLDDPTFKWGGGDWSGNVPARLSPEFPPMTQHYNADFHSWVKAVGVKCEQTDFGAWVACVTKVQIMEFITKVYMGKESLPWVGERLKDLDTFITTLKANETYGLVATEW